MTLSKSASFTFCIDTNTDRYFSKRLKSSPFEAMHFWFKNFNSIDKIAFFNMFTADKLMMVLEYSPYGNLKEYIKNNVGKYADDAFDR